MSGHPAIGRRADRAWAPALVAAALPATLLTTHRGVSHD